MINVISKINTIINRKLINRAKIWKKKNEHLVEQDFFSNAKKAFSKLKKKFIEKPFIDYFVLKEFIQIKTSAFSLTIVEILG